MPYYANGIWWNWSTLIEHTNATTNPVASLTGTVAKGLPWFWPAVPFVLYIYLILIYDEAPSRMRLAGISAIVLVVSIIMTATGLLPDAVINVVIFGVAWFGSYLFKL